MSRLSFCMMGCTHVSHVTSLWFTGVMVLFCSSTSFFSPSLLLFNFCPPSSLCYCTAVLPSLLFFFPFIRHLLTTISVVFRSVLSSLPPPLFMFSLLGYFYLPWFPACAWCSDAFYTWLFVLLAGGLSAFPPNTFRHENSHRNHRHAWGTIKGKYIGNHISLCFKVRLSEETWGFISCLNNGFSCTRSLVFYFPTSLILPHVLCLLVLLLYTAGLSSSKLLTISVVGCLRSPVSVV